jgi:peptidoglycan LD-endopeptidase LytH
MTARRWPLDLRTAPGILLGGVIAGALFGLAFILGSLALSGSTDREAGALEAPGDGGLLFPIEGGRPETIGAEGFLARRAGFRRHEAVDILAPRGTPVLAATDGIAHLTRHGGTGVTVEQDDAGGRYCLVYAHLDRYAAALQDGDRVLRGQVVGYVGSTGNASPAAPHLHFAVRRRAGGGCWSGAALDPLPLFAR